MQPVTPFNNYNPVPQPPIQYQPPPGVYYQPVALNVPFQSLQVDAGELMYVNNPNGAPPGVNCMYVCPANDPRVIFLTEKLHQTIPQPSKPEGKEYENPLCRRCAKNPVGIRCGRAMKTCASCLSRLRKYQRDNFRRRAIETNSVICSTCNKRPAMIKGNKQYRTCRDCSNRKKFAYYEDRERSRNAINFFNLAMKHFDALPPEIFSPVIKK